MGLFGTCNFQKRNDFMALMMNAHKEAQDVDKEHDTEFKEAYGTSVKRGEEYYSLISFLRIREFILEISTSSPE